MQMTQVSQILTVSFAWQSVGSAPYIHIHMHARTCIPSNLNSAPVQEGSKGSQYHCHWEDVEFLHFFPQHRSSTLHALHPPFAVHPPAIHRMGRTSCGRGSEDEEGPVGGDRNRTYLSLLTGQSCRVRTDTRRRSIYSDDMKWVDGINALFLILGID